MKTWMVVLGEKVMEGCIPKVVALAQVMRSASGWVVAAMWGWQLVAVMGGNVWVGEGR
jgi:hypothetical protein